MRFTRPGAPATKSGWVPNSRLSRSTAAVHGAGSDIRGHVRRPREFVASMQKVGVPGLHTWRSVRDGENERESSVVMERPRHGPGCRGDVLARRRGGAGPRPGKARDLQFVDMGE